MVSKRPLVSHDTPFQKYKCTVPGQLNHINNNKQPPHICRKQLKYTPQAGIDLSQPKLITKVANGAANIEQCTDKDVIGQPRTVHR